MGEGGREELANVIVMTHSEDINTMARLKKTELICCRRSLCLD